MSTLLYQSYLYFRGDRLARTTPSSMEITNNQLLMSTFNGVFKLLLHSHIHAHTNKHMHTQTHTYIQTYTHTNIRKKMAGKKEIVNFILEAASTDYSNYEMAREVCSASVAYITVTIYSEQK